MADEVQELRRLIAELTERVYRLEQRAAYQSQAGSPYAASSTPPAVSASVIVPPPVGSPGFPGSEPSPHPSKPKAGLPGTPSLPETPRKASASLESRIGSQWFNRIGIIAVLVGIALALKYAFENDWVGPGVRVAIGLAAGVAVTLWSERFRGHGYLVFSWSLKAIGAGTLYLSLWAGFQVYHLFSLAIGFVAMVLVTAAMTAISLSQNAEILAAFALVGGFATPVLLSTGQDREIALFSYLILLDAACAVLAAARPWPRLLTGGLAGTAILFAGWYYEFYSPALLAPTLAFAAVFFLIFLLAGLFAARPAVAQGRQPAQTPRALPILNACVFFLQLLFLLQDVHRMALANVMLVLSLLYFGLIQLGRMDGEHTRRNALPVVGSRQSMSSHTVLAVACLTAAIPLGLEVNWITCAWLIEAVALLWISYRFAVPLVRVLAAGVLLLGIFRLLIYDSSRTAVLLINTRFGLYVLAAGVLAFGTIMARRYPRGDGSSRADEVTVGVAVVLLNLLVLVALNLEVHDYFLRSLDAMRQTSGAGRLPWGDVRNLDIVRDFSYSAVCMAYGAALMWAGFARRSAFLRWQALILLAATVVKVFTYDVSELDRGYRIASFIALGVLLLAISFLYQRDWLRLSPER
jgi:uncharacterized membrane protein